MYIAGIIFTVFTHKHLFFAQPPVEAQTEIEGQKTLSLGRKGTDREGEAEGERNHEHWGKKKSFVLLGISMAGVVIVSEILVGSSRSHNQRIWIWGDICWCGNYRNSWKCLLNIPVQ